MNEGSIIIIGAGFAGLAAGIYAQMNGYKTEIYEMHNLPGGLCTAWQRKGYTIDGCIHWLVGSSPESGMYRYWEEVGVAQGREFIYMDEFSRYEGEDGRTLIFHSDLDKLEEHLLALSPQDAAPIKDFIRGARIGLKVDQPSPSDSRLTRLRKGLNMLQTLAFKGRAMRRWMNTSMADFAERFKDPLLRRALRDFWFPDFAAIFMFFTFAYLHKKNAGYPIGGALPMSQAMAQRYTDLGGTIHYNSRVERILVEDDRAVGIRLADGIERRADRVISAADGHATLYDMLQGEYLDEEIERRYEEWPIFPPLLYVGLGVNRDFADTPQTISGINFPLRRPTEIEFKVRDRMSVHIYNQDPTLAPAGKTALTVMLTSDYGYWQELAQDRAAYEEKEDQIAATVIGLLDQRFPGISGQVEMVDVATPMTFERYTGNWQGSFEGWLLTPDNASSIFRPMPQTLAGLERFYMCGQWVEPGGGLRTGVTSGRRLVKKLCEEDEKAFETTVA